MSRVAAPMLSVALAACASQMAFAPGAFAGPHDALIAKHAAANGVPEQLIRRVIQIESRGNAGAVHAGNYGLMQIRLGTARGVGYSGDAQGLLDPDTNLTYAVKYLAGAYRAAGCDADRAVSYYQRGYYGAARRECAGSTCAAQLTQIAQADAKSAAKPANAALRCHQAEGGPHRNDRCRRSRAPGAGAAGRKFRAEARRAAGTPPGATGHAVRQVEPIVAQAVEPKLAPSQRLRRRSLPLPSTCRCGACGEIRTGVGSDAAGAARVRAVAEARGSSRRAARHACTNASTKSRSPKREPSPTPKPRRTKPDPVGAVSSFLKKLVTPDKNAAQAVGGGGSRSAVAGAAAAMSSAALV